MSTSSLIRIARRAGQVAIDSHVALPVRLADLLQGIGLRSLAEQLLQGLYDAYPYDYPLAQHLGDLRYQNRESEYAIGTAERNQFILRSLWRAIPTDRLSAAYFRNLEAMLGDRPPRGEPGRVVLGLGTGRCGSTSLAAILASIEGAQSTHENPPLIFWQPLPQQVKFHLQRFRLLSRYFPLVSDCAHWWLNVIDTVFDSFPSARAIALHRDTEACVRSWAKITRWPRDHNHWVTPRNRLWHRDRFDPSFPQYPMPEDAARNPEVAKEQLIRRYVSEYNDRLRGLAAHSPERILLLRTEELDDAATRQRISKFLGLPVGAEPLRLNTKSVTDAQSTEFWF